MKNETKTHKDLILYKKAVIFVSDIYELTNSYPPEEKFGVISQLRRASVSIPTNIAEGSGRSSKKEFRRFLFISLGSISEIETLFEISLNLNYIDSDQYNALNTNLGELRKMTSSLIKSLNI